VSDADVSESVDSVLLSLSRQVPPTPLDGWVNLADDWRCCTLSTTQTHHCHGAVITTQTGHCTGVTAHSSPHSHSSADNECSGSFQKTSSQPII